MPGLWFLCWSLLARAESPPASSPVASPALSAAVVDPWTTPFSDVLEHAKKVYFGGDHAEAMRVLQVLQQRAALGERVSPDDVAEAGIYLGEIRYNLADYDGAAAAFRGVLDRDPQRSINPYLHPTEVVGLFELVRQSVQRERERAVVPSKTPFPTWGYAPFGVGQLVVGRPRRAATFGAVQLGLGLVSIASYASLKYMNDADRVAPEELDAHVRKVQNLRYFLQWPATIGFYATWGISVADARARYQKR